MKLYQIMRFAQDEGVSKEKLAAIVDAAFLQKPQEMVDAKQRADNGWRTTEQGKHYKVNPKTGTVVAGNIGVAKQGQKVEPSKKTGKAEAIQAAAKAKKVSAKVKSESKNGISKEQARAKHEKLQSQISQLQKHLDNDKLDFSQKRDIMRQQAQLMRQQQAIRPYAKYGEQGSSAGSSSSVSEKSETTLGIQKSIESGTARGVAAGLNKYKAGTSITFTDGGKEYTYEKQPDQYGLPGNWLQKGTKNGFSTSQDIAYALKRKEGNFSAHEPSEAQGDSSKATPETASAKPQETPKYTHAKYGKKQLADVNAVFKAIGEKDRGAGTFDAYLRNMPQGTEITDKRSARNGGGVYTKQADGTWIGHLKDGDVVQTTTPGGSMADYLTDDPFCQVSKVPDGATVPHLDKHGNVSTYQDEDQPEITSYAELKAWKAKQREKRLQTPLAKSVKSSWSDAIAKKDGQGFTQWSNRAVRKAGQMFGKLPNDSQIWIGGKFMGTKNGSKIYDQNGGHSYEDAAWNMIDNDGREYNPQGFAKASFLLPGTSTKNPFASDSNPFFKQKKGFGNF